MQNGNLIFDESVFNSHLSFRPLIECLKKSIAEGNPGMQRLYGRVISEIESHPELMETITDLSVLDKHTGLIEELLSAVFPATTPFNIHAVALPFKFETVYTSPLFKAMLLKPGTNEINVPSNKVGASLSNEKLQFAYGLILKKYLGYNSPDNASSIHPYIDPVTGLTRYMELRIDAHFIDVKPLGEMPKLPDSIICDRSNRIMSIAELMEEVPIEKFAFEGLSVVRVKDVTDQEVISLIKNRLLHLNVIPDANGYKELEAYIQSLIGLKNVKVGLTPFMKVNGHYVYSSFVI